METTKEALKELVVDATGDDVSIALLENGRLAELSEESSSGHAYSLADVFLGKVKKLLPALNAAFVDIGDDKEAFLHYLDLGLYFNCFDEFSKKCNPNAECKEIFTHITPQKPLPKDGRIEDYLKVGQMVLVQIIKEPISTKGSRLTAEISLAGRNVVILPFNPKVTISSKISSAEEKKRLRSLVESILPKNYGAIIRTAAEGKNAAVLDAEIISLVDKWESSFPLIAKNKVVKPLFSEYSRTTTILRDLFSDSFASIYVNNKVVYEEARKYVEMISPGQEKIVKLYTGKEHIFDHFEVRRQIKSAFGKIVPLRQGAYLVVEHTEAMHVIDVNSGTRSKGKEQEQNTFDVNCYAAEEIARQLRLRDMGGIIIVDFIDMEDQEHRNALYKYMQEQMKGDRARHSMLPLTKYGLMQITRQRVRPVTEINTTEVCPMCEGTGKITSSLVIDEAIERKISSMVHDNGVKEITLKLNPVLEAYLTKGWFRSIVAAWRRKYKVKIKTLTSSELSLLQYEIN